MATLMRRDSWVTYLPGCTIALMVAIVAIVLAVGAAQASSSTESGSLDSASLMVLGVRTGGSETLSDVVSRLGPAEVWQTGDAAVMRDVVDSADYS